MKVSAFSLLIMMTPSQHKERVRGFTPPQSDCGKNPQIEANGAYLSGKKCGSELETNGLKTLIQTFHNHMKWSIYASPEALI